MKKYLVYMTCAAAAMIGGTGCSDFGDVNMDPEHLNSENIPTELLFTNGQHQMLGSDWDVWRNGCIYAAQWMSHTASFNWLGNANYTWNDGYSGAYWEIYNGDARGAPRHERCGGGLERGSVTADRLPNRSYHARLRHAPHDRPLRGYPLLAGGTAGVVFLSGV
jgi:hypothetical protein